MFNLFKKKTKINVLIIGFGAIGIKHHNTLSQDKKNNIYIISKKKDIKGNFIKKFTTIDDFLLQEITLDYIFICNPNFLHIETIKKFKDFKATIFCEKPLVTCESELKEIEEMVNNNNLIVFTLYNLSYQANTIFLSNYLKHNLIGEFFNVEISWKRSRGIPNIGGWHTNKDMSGGGALIDIGCHGVSLFYDLFENFDLEEFNSITKLNHYFENKNIDTYKQIENWGNYNNENKKINVEDAFVGFFNFNKKNTLFINMSWASNFKEEKMKIECSGKNYGFTWYKNGKLTIYENGIPRDVKLSNTNFYESIMSDKFCTKENCLKL